MRCVVLLHTLFLLCPSLGWRPEVLEQRALRILEQGEAKDTADFSAWVSLVASNKDTTMFDFEQVGGHVVAPSFYFSKTSMEYWSALVLGADWDQSLEFLPHWKGFSDITSVSYQRFQERMAKRLVPKTTFKAQMQPFLEWWPVMEHTGHAYEQYIQIFSSMFVQLPEALTASSGKLSMSTRDFVDRMVGRVEACSGGSDVDSKTRNSTAANSISNSVRLVTQNFANRAVYNWRRGDKTNEPTDKITICEFVREALVARGLLTRTLIDEAQDAWNDLSTESGGVSYTEFVNFIGPLLPVPSGAHSTKAVTDPLQGVLKATFRMVALNTMTHANLAPLDLASTLLSPCEFQYLYMLVKSNAIKLTEDTESSDAVFDQLAPCPDRGLSLDQFRVMLEMYSAAKVTRVSRSINTLFDPSNLYWDAASDGLGGGRYAESLFRAIACQGDSGVDPEADITSLTVTPNAIIQYFKKTVARESGKKESDIAEAAQLQAVASLSRVTGVPESDTDELDRTTLSWHTFSRSLLSNLPFDDMTREDVSLPLLNRADFRQMWICLDKFAHQLERTQELGVAGTLPPDTPFPTTNQKFRTLTTRFRFPQYYERCKHFVFSCEETLECSAPKLNPRVIIKHGCTVAKVGSKCSLGCEPGYTPRHGHRGVYECGVRNSMVRYADCAPNDPSSCAAPHQFVCQAMQCDHVELPQFSEIVSGCVQGGKTGAPCVLQCKDGYVRVMSPDMPLVSSFPCAPVDSTVKYNVENFQCIPRTCPVPTIANGMFVCNSLRTAPESLVNFNVECTLTCTNSADRTTDKKLRCQTRNGITELYTLAVPGAPPILARTLKC